MDEQQKKKPVRRISGRLTDTIRETDMPENQSVFTPRRVRPKHEDTAAKAENTGGKPADKEVNTADKSKAAPYRREEKQLKVFVPQHKLPDQQQESAMQKKESVMQKKESVIQKQEAEQKGPETTQTEGKTAKIIHPERHGKNAQPEAEQERRVRPVRQEAEQEHPVRPERRSAAPAPSPTAVNPAGKRRREQENEARMRTLWGALSFLTVVLIIAIFYEVILGHGIKQTGAERMAEQKREKMESVIEILDETEGVLSETEVQSETADSAAEDMQTEAES